MTSARERPWPSARSDKARALEARRYVRERKFAGMALTEIEEDGAFSGYASVFGTVDMGHDLVERGAFARSLRKRGPESVRMLFQHDPNQPIGRWMEIREDERGLFVRGQLTPGVLRSQEVLRLMRAGALDGLSIGFKTVRARRDERSGVRRILEADLWEISVVTFPMQPDARVTLLKGLGPTGGLALPDVRLPFGPASNWRRQLRLAERIRKAAIRMKQKEWN